MDTPNIYTYTNSPGLVRALKLINISGVKLVLCAHTPPLSEMMLSCKCFPRVTKLPTVRHNRRRKAFQRGQRQKAMMYKIPHRKDDERSSFGQFST